MHQALVEPDATWVEILPKLMERPPAAEWLVLRKQPEPQVQKRRELRDDRRGVLRVGLARR